MPTKARAAAPTGWASHRTPRRPTVPFHLFFTMLERVRLSIYKALACSNGVTWEQRSRRATDMKMGHAGSDYLVFLFVFSFEATFTTGIWRNGAIDTAFSLSPPFFLRALRRR